MVSLSFPYVMIDDFIPEHTFSEFDISVVQFHVFLIPNWHPSFASFSTNAVLQLGVLVTSPEYLLKLLQ
jgi:hypothetical protein